MPSGKPILGKNDLLSQYPDLVKNYWDFERNIVSPDAVVCTGAKDCFWICPKCRKSYSAKVLHRVIRTTDLCNECAGWKSKKSKKTVRDALNNIDIVWDYHANAPKKPEDYSYQSNKFANWICAKCGNHFPMRIQDRVLKGNDYTCPICTKRVLRKGINDFVSYCKKNGLTLYEDWDYELNGDKRPENYFPNSEEKVWWHCHNNKFRPHSFKAAITNRVQNAKHFNSNGCNVCRLLVLVPGVNDLETYCKDNNIDILKDWDRNANGNLTPKDVPAGGVTRVNWKCHRCGCTWSQDIRQRLRDHGCPAEGNSRVVVTGVNDFESYCRNNDLLYLLEEWDTDKNTALGYYPNKIAKSFNKDVWWICKECGYSWSAKTGNRSGSNRTGCPNCSGSKGEKICYEIIKEVGLKSKREFSFRNTIVKDFRYDLFIEHNRLLIEYDGLQHFKSNVFLYTQPAFKTRVRYDNTKNSYAFNSVNLPLLRIPYVYDAEQDKEKIAQLLKDFISIRKIPQEIIDFYQQFEFSNYAKLAREWNGQQAKKP